MWKTWLNTAYNGLEKKKVKKNMCMTHKVADVWTGEELLAEIGLQMQGGPGRTSCLSAGFAIEIINYFSKPFRVAHNKRKVINPKCAYHMSLLLMVQRNSYHIC